MPVAIDPGATWEYVLEVDRKVMAEQNGADLPEGEKPFKPTTFELRTIPAKIMARIEDNLAHGDKEGNFSVRMGGNGLDILMHGLSGWRDFFMANGAEVKFLTKPWLKDATLPVVDPRLLDHLSHDHRAELVKAITERNEAPAGLLKN